MASVDAVDAATGVTHDESRKRFFMPADAEHKKEAFVEYRWVHNNQVMDLYHTETPPEARGRGLAGKVVQAAINYAQSNDLKVRPTCPYVADYINKHVNDVPNIHKLLE